MCVSCVPTNLWYNIHIQNNYLHKIKIIRTVQCLYVCQLAQETALCITVTTYVVRLTSYFHIFWSLCYFLVCNSAGHCAIVPINDTLTAHIFCSCIRTYTSK